MNSFYLQITNQMEMQCNSDGNLIRSDLPSGNCSHLESVSFMIPPPHALLPLPPQLPHFYLDLFSSVDIGQTSHFPLLGCFAPRGSAGKRDVLSAEGFLWSHFPIALEGKNHPNSLPIYKTTVLGVSYLLSIVILFLFIHVFIYYLNHLLNMFINVYIS